MVRAHLDHLNGRPLSTPIRAAIEEALGSCGNPSSIHAGGRAAALLLKRARGQVARLAGARPEDLFFTAGGTESNAWVLRGLAQSVRRTEGPSGTLYRNEIVVSAVEHLSVLQTAREMEKEGWSVTLVPVNAAGRVDPARVEEALTPQTALVSVQWANSEVGTLQPVAEIARRVRAKGISFHTDAVAAAGRVPLEMAALPIDALSLASGPLGGPPGAGALVLRRGVRIRPLFMGGTQEEGRRAGTENLLGIAGFGAAAEGAARELPSLQGKVLPLRERLVRGILDIVSDASFNGDPADRLPGHISVSFPGADAEALVLALDREGVSVGLGSACSSKAVKASHVLKAMGVGDRQALGTITLTYGQETSAGEVDRFLAILPRALNVLGKETIRR